MPTYNYCDYPPGPQCTTLSAAADIQRCLPLNLNVTKIFSNKNDKFTQLIDLALYIIGRLVTGTTVFDDMKERLRSSFGFWVYGACNTGEGPVFRVCMHV